MQDIDIARQLSLTLPSKPKTDQLGYIGDCKEYGSMKSQEHRSDVVYRAKTLNDQWVYLLFEHKSSPDRRIHRFAIS